MKSLTLTISRLALAVVFAMGVGAMQQAAAQTGDPTGPAGPAPTSPTPTTVPIDGGASLLLAGGVAYGLRKLRQRRQR